MKYLPWIVGVLLSLAILMKLDLLLMGYFLIPLIFWRVAFGICGGSALAIYLIRRRNRRWFAILPLFVFQPIFPSAAGMYLLGYSRCVEEKLNIPGIIAWAENYTFPQTNSKPDDMGNLRVDLKLVSIPEVPKRLGPVFISKPSRTVFIRFGSLQGVVIGADAENESNEQRTLFARKRLTEHAYVWVNAEPP